MICRAFVAPPEPGSPPPRTPVPTCPKRLHASAFTPMLRRLALVLAALLAGLGVVLGVVLGVNAARVESRQVAVAPAVRPAGAELRAAAGRLGRLVRVPSVTRRAPGGGARLDSAVFRALHDTLAAAFPRVVAALRVDTVGAFSRLLTWPGADPALAPAVFVAHLDVVPVEAGTDTAWTHPPFGGVVAGGFVWGRGALDDKASAAALLEAADRLLAADVQPQRTVMLALGHDEEVGGRDGARALAALLAQRGVEPAFVLDEGGAVTVGAVPGITRPVALVGIAEKGYLSVELRADAPGGHASMPAERLAIDVLSAAVRRLTSAPLPARLTGVTGTTFDFLAPEMPFLPRAAFANRWLLAPALRYALAQRPVTAAAIRTTTAPTVFEAGEKDNVIPSTARAVVNFRLLPGDTVGDVLAHVRATLDGLGVRVRRLQHSEATPVAPTDGAAFAELQRAIQAATPEAVVVAPYLVPGATDARHYARLTERVYRFVPFRLGPGDRSRIHGTDERLALADYATLVAFYQRLMHPPAHDSTGSDGP